MDESRVSTLLAERAGRVDVGHPPIEDARRQGHRIRRRRMTLAASAGAAAVVVAVAVAAVIVRPGADTGPAPATQVKQSDDAFGHSVLTPEMLELRGAELAEALGLQRSVTDPETGSGTCPPPSKPGGYAVETDDGPAWCVAVGNAPDDWLASMLIWDHPDAGERLLREVGIGWQPDLPPPPPVVTALVREHLDDIASEYGEDSVEYSRARLWLDTARPVGHLDPGWEAAGWNDHYWGDPWWTVSTPTHGALTDREFDVAVAVARQEVDKLGLPITSATATVGEGTVTDSNIGQPCTSGTLLHIKLIGDFHTIPHGGVPGQPYEPTTAVLITADPESGQACLIGVATGEQRPEDGSVLLFTE